MIQQKFQVIKGGIDLPPEIDKRVFCSAYATDTRLMGVLGLSVHWEIEKHGIPDDFYQFFYLDAEEYAIENYISVRGNNPEEIHKVESALVGGLGGERVELTERECRILLQSFADLNVRYHQPLPDGYSEYSFFLEPRESSDREERAALMRKICTKITNEYQLIHYFLMRTFGKDLRAAAFLATPGVNLHLYQDLAAATLCRNTIDPDPARNGTDREDSPSVGFPRSYLCESLLELDDLYMIVISRLEVNARGRISAFERISTFRVTAAEAAMQLAKPEFMTIYTLLFDSAEFETRCGSLVDEAMVSSHENGKMYMLFHKDNDHVKHRTFLLNEDVRGLLFLSDAGQLLAVSYSLPGIHRLESSIRRSPIAGAALPTAKYEFKEPILYDFVQSDFDDFNEFLDYIREDN